jgi:iron(III) transport system substrate-binding protein
VLISSAGGNPIYRALLQLSTPIPRARVQSLAALALTLIIALVPRHSLAQPQPWSSVTSAAQREGRLTVYNGTGFRIVRLLADQFQRDYGMAVDVLDGRASEIRERIRAEQAAGRAIGDMIYSGSTSIALQTAEGAFAPYGDLPNAGKISAPLKSDGTFLPVSAGYFAVLVNAKDVAAAEAPKGWRDLTEPKWQGKILSDDPRALGAGEVWFEVTYEAFGREFHEAMAKQKPVFSRDFAQSNQRVARGEYPLYLPFNASEFQRIRGLPIRVVVPSEGVPYVALGPALLKNAPHPNAARMFMNFMLERNGQELIANEGFRPAVAGTPLPADLAPIIAAKPLGTTTPGKTQMYLDLAAEIYGK